MQFFLILPTFLFAIFLVYGFSRKPRLAVFFVLLASVINAWFIELPSVKIGLNIYLHDAVFILIFISANVRIFFMGQVMYISSLWTIYGIIIFYGLYSGLKLNGTVAGIDFRDFFYYWSGALYCMSFSYSNEMLEKIQKDWFWLCFILLGIVYFRFVADFLHLPISKTWISADNTGVRFRVVSSAQAYLLGVATVILFIRYLLPEAIKPKKIITILFIIAVIVLQHRSVWVATIFAITSATLLPGIKTTRMLNNLLVIGVLGFIVLTPILYLGYADSFLGSISESAEKATHLSKGTFGDRMRGWYRIMEYWQPRPFLNQAFGDPFGGKYAGMDVVPHNFFFHSLLRAGLFGTLLIIMFYLFILGKLYLNIRQHPDNRIYLMLFFMLIIGQMAYYIPYGPQPEHGIILGIAASLAKRKDVIENNKKIETSRNSQYFLKTPFSKNRNYSA